jgi:hypothetical protein
MKKYLKLSFLTALLISCNGIVPVVIATAGSTPNAPISNSQGLEQLQANALLRQDNPFNYAMQEIEEEMYRLQVKIQNLQGLIKDKREQHTKAEKKGFQTKLANTQKSLDDLSEITKMQGLVLNSENQLLADSQEKTICIIDNNTLRILLRKESFQMNVEKLYAELGLTLTKEQQGFIKNNEFAIKYDPQKQTVRFANLDSNAQSLNINDKKIADLYKLQDIQGLWLEHTKGIHIVNTDNGSVNTDNDSLSLLEKIGIGVCVVTVFAAIGGGALYINKGLNTIKELDTIEVDYDVDQILDLS